jgi:hypothetical protein
MCIKSRTEQGSIHNPFAVTVRGHTTSTKQQNKKQQQKHKQTKHNPKDSTAGDQQVSS